MRHQWDKPSKEGGKPTHERTCKRCGAVVRKFHGDGKYQYWPDGLGGTKFVQWIDRIPECREKLLPESERFRPHQQVSMTYGPDGIFVRRAYALEDNGGEKVKVSYQTKEGPKVGRNVVLYHGHRVEQWVKRDRLS